ncbi:MAG: carboxypeptidase-like regulatory domain-containing protein [Ignavibacteriales bacterium]|nr:carboxypeptidase-like regulatory domain-containing protein [Ignavibacteriales bacterium]
MRKIISWKGVIILLAVLPFVNTGISAQQKNGIALGTVKEKGTGSPLPNVNVFLSGTTLGAATDEMGNFEIEGVPDGKYTVVASMIGFKTQTRNVEVTNNKISLGFILEPKEYEMETVEVSGDVPEEWKQNLETFKKFFLGQTEQSGECVVENEYKIDFSEDAIGNLNAKIFEPLMIINNALGYKIECILLLFYCNDKAGSVKFLIHTKFTELKSDNEDDKEKWAENRKLAYLKSMKRLLKSITQNELFENDYSIGFNFTPSSPLEIKKAKELIAKRESNKWMKDSKPISSYEIVKYSSEDKNYTLSFDNYLYVYNSITDDLSWLFLPYRTAMLDKYSEPIDPISIQAFGSLAKNGTANLLPLNYEYAK